MSGHSKWAQIKRQKAITDGKKGQAFTKLARAVTAAAKQGGPNPDMNPGLRFAIDQALAANMPKDNIDRAIDRATGAEAAATQNVLFEGYGPAGVAFLVHGVTDNNNRTVAEIRHLFNQHGGSLGGAGSVQWQFDGRTPKHPLQLDEATKNAVLELVTALEDHDDVMSVVTNVA